MYPVVCTFSLRSKFKQFIEEYQVREKHFKAVIQTKDSEYTLIQSKYDLLNENLQESKEDVLKNKAREAELLKQNASYASKLKEAEETLSKSNELFMTYRSQLDVVRFHLCSISRLFNSLNILYR